MVAHVREGRDWSVGPCGGLVKGGRGRWEQTDALCMADSFPQEGQLRPVSEEDRLTQ